MKKLLLLIVGITLAFGCAQKGKSDNPVLAQGSGVTIKKDDFMKKIERLPEWALGRFRSEEGKKEFLNELIKEELLYKEALKQGLNKDKEIQGRIEEFTRMNVISALLKKEIEEKVIVDDAAAREYYDKNMDEFKMGFGISAKHILVNTKEEADNILKKIRQGEKFENLAKKFSKDPVSAQNGGDLGFFGKGRMIPEFEKAAFNLKIGETTSEPVKTDYGYHIIRVIDKKEGELRGFEEVKDSIQNRLKTEQQRNLFKKYMDNLMEKNKVKINDAKLNSVSIPGADTGEGTSQLSPHGQLKVE